MIQALFTFATLPEFSIPLGDGGFHSEQVSSLLFPWWSYYKSSQHYLTLAKPIGQTCFTSSHHSFSSSVSVRSTTVTFQPVTKLT